MFTGLLVMIAYPVMTCVLLKLSESSSRSLPSPEDPSPFFPPPQKKFHTIQTRNRLMAKDTPTHNKCSVSIFTRLAVFTSAMYKIRSQQYS